MFFRLSDAQRGCNFLITFWVSRDSIFLFVLDTGGTLLNVYQLSFVCFQPVFSLSYTVSLPFLIFCCQFVARNQKSNHFHVFFMYLFRCYTCSLSTSKSEYRCRFPFLCFPSLRSIPHWSSRALPADNSVQPVPGHLYGHLSGHFPSQIMATNFGRSLKTRFWSPYRHFRI